jgi:hypothetical protein
LPFLSKTSAPLDRAKYKRFAEYESEASLFCYTRCMKENLTESLPYEPLTFDDEVSLRQLQLSDAVDVFATVDDNRSYLSQWLPWVEGAGHVANVWSKSKFD